MFASEQFSPSLSSNAEPGERKPSRMVGLTLSPVNKKIVF